MQIKRNGIDVTLERDYDANNEYISEFLKDYSGFFAESKFTVPERLSGSITAEHGGYKIVEGYGGGCWSYEHFAKGEEISPTYHRQYDLVTYGRKNDVAMDKIIEELDAYAEAEFYYVKIIGVNGERVDSLGGISFEKDLDDMTINEILKTLEDYGVEFPKEFNEENALQKLISQLISMRWAFTVYNCVDIVDQPIAKFIDESHHNKDELFITFVMGNEEPIIFEDEEDKINEMIKYLKEW